MLRLMWKERKLSIEKEKVFIHTLLNDHIRVNIVKHILKKFFDPFIIKIYVCVDM